jgi:Niemann-Pick C1 protein
MFIYITIAIGEPCSKVHSGWLLGLFGVTIVIMSLVCSVGLAGYLGIGLSMISAEVVPFLVLAIGVDNMFIISHAYKRTSCEYTIE